MKKIIFAFSIMIFSNSIFADCQSSYIKYKSDDGSIIITPEATYQVSIFDRINTRLWLINDNVVFCDDNMELINTDENEKATVNQLY
jgi:hypothetical protein